MDTIIFRKMTLKSRIDFGKYAGMTVQGIFNVNRSYLRFIYYTIPSLSFTDEVLKEIGIYNDTYDFRINKPGVDLEMFDKLKAFKFNRQCHALGNAAVAVNYAKKIIRLSYIQSKHIDQIYFSKGSMQARNQGK